MRMALVGASGEGYRGASTRTYCLPYVRGQWHLENVPVVGLIDGAIPKAPLKIAWLPLPLFEEGKCFLPYCDADGPWYDGAEYLIACWIH